MHMRLFTAIAATGFIFAAVLSGCEMPRYHDEIPGYDFSGYSKYTLERKVELLAVDSRKAVQRFFDSRDTQNVRRVIGLFIEAKNRIYELRDLYKELDKIKCAQDPVYADTRDMVDPEHQLFNGINYYHVMLQTEQSIADLLPLDPELELGQAAMLEYRKTTGQ
jgi:hypothetical protein